ncbi:hypothetical protein P4O66_011878, partial [Electrophorus voltai]
MNQPAQQMPSRQLPGAVPSTRICHNTMQCHWLHGSRDGSNYKPVQHHVVTVSYSQVIVEYPMTVLISCAVVLLTFSMAGILIGPLPEFSDPLLGFEPRGTDLGIRLAAWTKLQESTEPGKALSLTPQQFADQSIVREISSRAPHHLKHRSRRMLQIDSAENAFFCNAPGDRYAQLVFRSGNSASLWSLKAIYSMCEMEQTQFRYIWICWFAVLAAGGIYISCVDPGMKLPSSESRATQLFRSSHPFERYDAEYRHQFMFERMKPGEDEPMSLTLIWGVIPTDEGDHFNPKRNGSFAMDPEFNMSSSEAQVWLRDLCGKIKNQSFYSPPPAENEAVEDNACFVEDLIEWVSIRRCSESEDAFSFCCNAAEPGSTNPSANGTFGCSTGSRGRRSFNKEGGGFLCPNQQRHRQHQASVDKEPEQYELQPLACHLSDSFENSTCTSKLSNRPSVLSDDIQFCGLSPKQDYDRISVEVDNEDLCSEHLNSHDPPPALQTSSPYKRHALQPVVGPVVDRVKERLLCKKCRNQSGTRIKLWNVSLSSSSSMEDITAPKNMDNVKKRSLSMDVTTGCHPHKRLLSCPSQSSIEGLEDSNETCLSDIEPTVSVPLSIAPKREPQPGHLNGKRDTLRLSLRETVYDLASPVSGRGRTSQNELPVILPNSKPDMPDVWIKRDGR